jgi:hypothetical protein
VEQNRPVLGLFGLNIVGPSAYMCLPCFTVDKQAITRPCGPKDMISFSLSNELVLNGSNTLKPNKCLPFCLQTEYIEKLSEAIIDPEGVESYNSLAKTNILGDPK